MLEISSLYSCNVDSKTISLPYIQIICVQLSMLGQHIVLNVFKSYTNEI